MTTLVAVVLVVLTALFIAADAVKERRAKVKAPKADEGARQQTERLVKVEAEVEEKLKEIKRHQAAPGAAAGPSDKNGHDPMDDTRCMQTVKKKADEIERIAKERGFSV